MIDQLILAGALLLVIEGVLYALFPNLMRKAIAAALMAPESQMRIGGLAAMLLGIAIVWLVNYV